MISKMKKYSFLIFHKEYEDFLLQLRELGVVHVQEKQTGEATSERLKEALDKSAAIKAVEDFLLPYRDEKWTEKQEPASLERGEELLAKVEELRASLERLNQSIPAIQKDMDLMKPWGDFDYARINSLKAAGYEISFYVCSPKDYKSEWEKDFNAITVLNNGVSIYFVTVTNAGSGAPEIMAEKAKLSEKSLSVLEADLAKAEEERDKIKSELKYICNSCSKSIDMLRNSNLSELEFSKVELSGEKAAENRLYVLQGWIPEEDEQGLKDFLEQNRIFYEAETPKLTDNVPIKLKNGAFAKLFEPITRMFSLPNYSELDMTPFLAPFFMLFFGLCMGDGGYGMLILLASIYLRKKVKENMKGICTLGIYLGAATIFVGVVTGSFFGIALDSVEWTWLKDVKQYFLTEKNFKDYFGGNNPMMIIAVVIGIIQILFGMCLAAVRITKQQGFKYCMSTIAWVVAIVFGIIYLALMFSGIQVPGVVNGIFYVIFGVCIVFIFFMNQPGSSIFSNIGNGIWSTYNMATGLLGDTLSYIRLFALGLTGSILGSVFNELAFTLTDGLPAVLQFVFALLILLFGHSINFGLCMISSLVHPLRLTFVEFYKNEGFEGGGKEYKPFKKNQITE